MADSGRGQARGQADAATLGGRPVVVVAVPVDALGILRPGDEPTGNEAGGGKGGPHKDWAETVVVVFVFLQLLELELGQLLVEFQLLGADLFVRSDLWRERRAGDWLQDHTIRNEPVVACTHDRSHRTVGVEGLFGADVTDLRRDRVDRGVADLRFLEGLDRLGSLRTVRGAALERLLESGERSSQVGTHALEFLADLLKGLGVTASASREPNREVPGSGEAGRDPRSWGRRATGRLELGHLFGQVGEGGVLDTVSGIRRCGSGNPGRQKHHDPRDEGGEPREESEGGITHDDLHALLGREREKDTSEPLMW